MSNSAPVTLNLTESAAWAGVSVNTFRKWKIPPLKKVGREVFFDLRDVAKSVYGREPIVVRELNLTHERARLQCALADKNELELAVMQKEYFPAGAVEMLWSGIFVVYRERLLALISKINEYKHREFIDDDIAGEFAEFITDALENLSRFDPLVGATDTDGDQVEATDGTEKTDDGQPVGGPVPLSKS